MQTIAVGSVIDFPALQIETAAAAAARQLVAVHAGEGVLNIIIWHTYSIIQRYTPQLVPAMRAARQQQGEISFTAINALQYPLALLSMALMPVMMWLAWRKGLPRPNRRTDRNGRGPHASGQRRRLRRLRQSARPLRCARGVAGDIGSRPCAGAAASDPPWAAGKFRINFPAGQNFLGDPRQCPMP